VLLVADDGAAYAAWHGGNRDSGRFTGWFSEWKSREMSLSTRRSISSSALADHDERL